MATEGLVLVYDEMTRSLNDLTTAWAGNRSVGLLQSTAPVAREWTMANVQPATFSGYSGLVPCTAWSAATIFGERALTRAAQVLWVHNGGPSGNWITGYYVVDQNGRLRWAQVWGGPALLMIRNGDTALVTPEYTFGSRFPSEGA